MKNDTTCDCLTTEDTALLHAARCGSAYDTPGIAKLDRTPLRELAELAAYKDIDTALTILKKLTA